jgi:transposase
MTSKKPTSPKKRGRRYELTDEAWERIEPLLPKQGRGGKWADHRTILNGMFWVLNSGSAWRDVPERYGKWQTVYDRFRRWEESGLFDRILRRLHLSLDEEGFIDWHQFNVDGTNIRAHHHAAGASKTSKKNDPTSPKTSPWDDPAEALARSFIF